MPVSSVKVDNHLPSLLVNGEALAPCGYMSYQIEKADYDSFIALGYKLIFVPVYAGDRGINPMSGIRPFYPGFWIGKDKYDFSVVDRNFKQVTKTYKPGEIWIIPRVMLEPPSFWEEDNPYELCRDFSGKSVHQSYSSEIWLEDTKKTMTAFQDYLNKSGIDEYVVGWQIACGWTEEFMRPMIYPMQLTDYSSTSSKSWRNHLRDKYKSLDGLNESWTTSFKSFDDIRVPSPAERVYLPEDTVKYPAIVAEYNMFRSVETASALVNLAGFAKRITGGNRVIGAFYGYAGTRFGHDALDVVLNSPDVDFLASPFAYDTQRAPGTDWVLLGAIGSARKHNKIWFTECDVRTHLSSPISVSMPHANPIGNTMYDGKIWYGPDDEETSIHQMRKVVAKTISAGAGMWWFDMWGGWFKTEKYMETIDNSLKLFESQLNEKSVAEVAIIYDTYARSKYPNNAGLEGFLQVLSRTGAAYEQFALTDIDSLDLKVYKSIVLLNVHERVPEIDKWKNRNHSIIYVASEYFDEKDDKSCPCKEGQVFVGEEYQKYVFLDIPSACALREAFQTSGVHIYSFTEDIVYAYGKMISIHATSDGEKRLFLPEKLSLEDAYTGEKLVPCDYFSDFSMKKGETRVFRILQ